MNKRLRILKTPNDKQRIDEILAAANWCASEVFQYFGKYMYFDSECQKMQFSSSCPFNEDELYLVECRLEELKECIKIIRDKTEINND